MKNLDIKKYFTSFPYSNISIHKSGKIFYKVSDGQSLFLHVTDTKSGLSNGKKVSDEDFAKRSYRFVDYDETKDIVYLISDNDNKEDFNLFKIDLENGKLEAVTKEDYLLTYELTPSKNALVYGARVGHDEKGYQVEFHHLDFKTGENRTFFTTSKEDDYRPTWSGVTFSRDEKQVLVRLDYQSKRHQNNLAIFDIDSGKYELLLDKSHVASLVYQSMIDYYDDYLYYISNLSGRANFYCLDLKTREIVQLSDFDYDLNSPHSFYDSNGDRMIAFSNSDPHGDRTIISTYRIDNDSLTLIGKKEFKGNCFVMGHSDGIWIYQNNLSLPGQYQCFRIDLSESLETISMVRGEVRDLINCQYEFVTYETFDGQSVPGFLTTPIEGEVKGAVIISFYGGHNNYSMRPHLFAEAGYAVFSPAPRGSTGYGKEWREKIYGDLGGDEIVDIIYGARFLTKKLGIKEKQVVVTGGSHGGYATLRTLTLPNPYNGIETSFDFGGGICLAGFADLIDFYKTSNIPDWLVQMLGDYNEDKYRERSPLNFFDNLKTPLFIAHGTNDARVSSSSMDGFIDKLKGSDKVYTLHMSEGQGHHTNDDELAIIEQQKIINFLNQVI